MTKPMFDARTIPFVTRETMIEIDRAMIEDYGIELIQMMENAGRNLADLARDVFFGGNPNGKRIAILAGPGGNGGGALVCGRRLANWGAIVEVRTAVAENAFAPVPAHQLAILKRMGIAISSTPPQQNAKHDLIIDGLFGYSLNRPPAGMAADLIEWANRESTNVLSLDIPSGIECNTGDCLEPAIQANATMTLALPKVGLRSARSNVGELYLADISVPPKLLPHAGESLSNVPIFSNQEIVRVW